VSTSDTQFGLYTQEQLEAQLREVRREEAAERARILADAYGHRFARALVLLLAGIAIGSLLLP
jgi:hypothetical protein